MSVRTKQHSQRDSPQLRRRRWLFPVLYAVYIVVLGGIAFRGYLWWQYGVQPTDFFNRVDPIVSFYPELNTRKIGDSRIGGEELQVLLLGGSVVEQVGDSLQTKLCLKFGRPVRVHNAAVSAHTTQDSVNKLEYLLSTGAEFDVILIYHGINDVRMNCVAANEFRDDYSHCHWYESYERRKQQGKFTIRDEINKSLDRLIGLGQPEANHVELGAEIKTGPAFQLHLERILELAEEQKTPVVLCSFATHFVDGYSKTKFLEKQLGYANGAYELPTEVWGAPDNVRRGVAVHNHVIREIADSHNALTFIDLQAELTDISMFTDVCHLSPAGIETFVEFVSNKLLSVDALHPALRK